MSNHPQRLKNILTFTVPAGGVVSLPHLLAWPARPVVPDVIYPSEASSLTFTADEINVTATNTGAQSVTMDVLVESWKTSERSFGDQSIEALVPQPFVVIGGADTSDDAAPVTSIVFRPGGIAVGNVYTTWAGTYAALQSVKDRGRVYLEFDDRLGLITVPIGTWNMTNVVWTNTPEFFLANPVTLVVLADGCSIVFDAGPPDQQTLHIEGYGLEIRMNRFGAVPQFEDVNLLLGGNHVRLSNTLPGSLPAIVGNGVNNSIGITSGPFTQIRCATTDGTSALIDVNGGELGLVFGAGQLRNGVITDLVGGGLVIMRHFDDAANGTFASTISLQHPGFVGAGGVWFDGGAEHRDRHAIAEEGVVTDPTYDARLNELVMVSTALNAVEVTAPPASPVLGDRFTVKDVNGNAGTVGRNITIVGFSGGQTVELGLINTAYGSKTWVCDGISNWMLSSDAAGPPTAAYNAAGVAATDRAPADGDSLADTISVLGTLIKDLQAKGILG